MLVLQALAQAYQLPRWHHHTPLLPWPGPVWVMMAHAFQSLQGVGHTPLSQCVRPRALLSCSPHGGYCVSWPRWTPLGCFRREYSRCFWKQAEVGEGFLKQCFHTGVADPPKGLFWV